jgi:hypothetical protein
VIGHFRDHPNQQARSGDIRYRINESLLIGGIELQP